MWAYQKFYQGQEPQGVHERGQWLLKIYAEATALLRAARTDETAGGAQPPRGLRRRTARDATGAGSRRSGGPRALWQKTRQWSLDELNDILAMLDIHIDVFFFESEVGRAGQGDRRRADRARRSPRTNGPRAAR